MSYEHTHILIDGGTHGVAIVAVIEYGIESASGDGWNEPREEAHPYIISVALEQVTTKPTVIRDERGVLAYGKPIVTREAIPGDTPKWVYAVLEDQEWWTEVDAESDDDADYRYDTMRDRALTDRVA